jgi:RNA polymerase sigma-70 factor (ECF subfamily)
VQLVVYSKSIFAELGLYLGQESKFVSAMDLELDELLARAQKLDQQALAMLHDQLFPQVYRYVCYRLDDPMICEDIASEVFLRLLDVLQKKGRRIRSVRAWLLGTANHLVQDHYRRRYRRRIDNIDDHDSIPSSHSPENEADKGFVRDEVKEALRNLTPDQQHVIALRFTQELSLEETAQVMGKTVNAVKVLQYRAIAALRRQMDGST